MKKGNIHIGTSGWSYPHWKNKFYPEGLPARGQFDYYSERYGTVELNNPFYRVPDKETFVKWRKKSPAHFIFSVKASRYFTHMKKLILDQPAIDDFFIRAGELKNKLGPVLFQLPPKWKMNSDRLQIFIEALPSKHQYCFEFRDQSWYAEAVYRLLEQYNCAFCIYDLAGHQSPLQVTANFVYIRLHGPGNKYQGSYSENALQQWSRKCTDWQNAGLDVYVYFDNDQDGYAAYNAQSLIEMTVKATG